MNKYLLTLSFLFLFHAVTAVKADDVAVIRSFLDSKTDNVEVLHKVYLACLSLTRTGTEDAVPVLKQLLDDERFITVAKTALANIQQPGLAQREPTQDEEKRLPTLTDALKEDSKIPFKMTLRAVLESKSEDTGTVVLDNMGNLPVEKQAALVRNLGARKDTVIVPRLIELAQGDRVELQLAAVEALGETGDLRAVDLLLSVVAADINAELAQTAITALKRFQGDEFDKKVVAVFSEVSAVFNDRYKKRQLVALELIGERCIASTNDKVKTLFSESDTVIRAAAYKAFALSATATAADIRTLLAQKSEGAQDAVREALLILCRKTADRENVVNLFAEALQTADSQTGSFYLDCLFQVGGDKASAVLASAAMGTDDALTDKATQLLGLWITPDVAPHLILIAEKHPVERYRVRALSGYLRVIQQMGLSLGQKVRMAEKALAVASRDADKQRATETLDRFQKMMKGTPIFDGKTFDGWEFRNNEKWFRIEDGAIVGGTFEGPIPHNEFVVSKKEYGDFMLHIECKSIGKGCNGGIQFRSVRTPADGPKSHEMIGYQADMGDNIHLWGALYDESRRNRFLVKPPVEWIESILRPDDWNEYTIICKGSNVKLFLNGILTVDYTETDPDIPSRGFIGLQIHSGPPSETWYRNIRIEE